MSTREHVDVGIVISGPSLLSVNRPGEEHASVETEVLDHRPCHQLMPCVVRIAGSPALGQNGITSCDTTLALTPIIVALPRSSVNETAFFSVIVRCPNPSAL